MRTIILTITILFFAINTFAHNPQVSTISIIQNKNKSWSVFITAPLYTCQLAIKANDPKVNIDSLDIVATQNLIISLVKNNFIINGNKNIKSENLKIQLSHETTIYLEIEDSVSITEIDFKAFSKLKDHFTLLKIFPYNGIENNYVLNSENEYVYIAQGRDLSSGYVNFNKYIHIISRNGILYIILSISALLIFFILFKRKILYK